MKYSILTLALAVCSQYAWAQLTQRDDSLRPPAYTGVRPEKGDMALTFGYDLTGDSLRRADLYGGNHLRPGNILSFKYFLTDQTAFRAGLIFSRSSTSSAGEFADSTYYYNNPTVTGPATFRSAVSNSYFALVPGVEHHFSNQNFFDVYAGGDLLLGLSRERGLSEFEINNGDYTNARSARNLAVFGLGGVVGFNIFIARLPVSLGLEYGLALEAVSGGAYRVRREDRITDVSRGVTDTYSSTYYLDEPYDPANMTENNLIPGSGQTQYKKLRMHSFGMDTNQHVRVTLNIYFGKQ